MTRPKLKRYKIDKLKLFKYLYFKEMTKKDYCKKLGISVQYLNELERLGATKEVVIKYDLLEVISLKDKKEILEK